VLIPLSELKPSPFNPKKPLTKKEQAAFRKCVKEFGWKRSLCVCRDFQSGEGFLTLDGNDAIKLLAEIGWTEVDCHIVEKVTDMDTLKQFMAGYSVHKDPIYSEFASAMGKIKFEEFTGLDFGKFSFDVNIDGAAQEFAETEKLIAEADDEKPQEKKPQARAAPAREERQTQFFLTLPPDCVDKLRNFVKTKAFNAGKTEAIAEKIDAMNDAQFLENILQIIL